MRKAVEVLKRHGMVELNAGMDPEETLQFARELAGPRDGREAVGKDRGPLRVVNSRSKDA